MSNKIVTVAEYNWQEIHETISSRNEYLLNNALWSDIKFHFKDDNVTIPAHRLILASASCVFAAMVFGDLSATASLDIVDMPSERFLELLRFIYTETITFTTDTAGWILIGANKYMLKCLEKRAVDFIVEDIKKNNACTYLEQCYLLDHSKINDKCLRLIESMTFVIVRTSDFLNLNEDTVKMILQLNVLNASEKELYSGVLLWSDNQCKLANMPSTTENRRRLAGKAVQQIRFPTMDMKTFLECVQMDANFLTDAEIGQITKSIYMCKEYSTVFSNIQRRRPMDFYDHQVWRHRHAREMSPRNFLQWPETFRIRLCSDTLLKGFGVYGIPGGKKTTHIKFSIQQIMKDGLFDTPTPTMQVIERDIVCDGSDRQYKFMFDEPIELKRMAYYMLEISFSPGYYYHVGCSSCKETNDYGLLNIEHNGFSCRIQELYFKGNLIEH